MVLGTMVFHFGNNVIIITKTMAMTTAKAMEITMTTVIRAIVF